MDHLLGAYRDNELPARVRRRVEAHLGECAQCRAELAALERLSELLGEDTLPNAFTSAETFRSQVVLKLSRRQRSRSGYLSWSWHLVPLALLCVLVGLMGLFAFVDLFRAAAATLGWVGVDVTSILSLPDVGRQPLFVSMFSGLGGLVWRLCAYLVSFVVFVSYAGWVGVLLRARAQPSMQKES
jgi:predicted anti-sigma-YlaC factor YlaD